MGCNCGGSKQQPVGQPITSRRTPSPAPPTGPSRPAATGQGIGQTQTTSGRTQSFALELNSGGTLTFGSRLEAEAENVRRGYAGKVRPA